jgi:hypothetical protein
MNSENSINNIKNIIEESGNNFHYKVVDFLRKNNWYVLVSPYYADNFSDKPREIDIIAEKNFPIFNVHGNLICTINVQLFIECKYIKEETVFWFDNRNKKDTIDIVLNTTPLKDPKMYSMTNNHHYISDLLVAKLFASKQKTIEGEIFYKAITQSLNAMISYAKNNSILPDVFNNIGNNKIEAILKYPVIICNSFENLYKTDVVEKKEPERINENFEIETRYTYFDNLKNQKNEPFLIDTVSFEFLEIFLKNLEEKDILAVKEIISWDKRNSNF